MEDLVLSCLESRVENNRNLYARFLVGPFIKGNALTVATALRRVLLSSVESVAITAIYIQGITHEFSTIVGVRESVLELSLNFQSIVLSYDKNFLKKKDFFEDFQIGYLQVQGPKVVYANDLKLPLGIKVVDPTQYIATISREGMIVLKFTIGKIDNRIMSRSSSHSFSPDPTKQVIHHPVFGELAKKNILKTKKRYFYKSIYAVNSLKSISQHRLIRAQECALISRVGSSFLNKKKNDFLKKRGHQPLLSPNLQFLGYNAKFCKKKASKTKLRFVHTDIQREIESKAFSERVKTPAFKSVSGNLRQIQRINKSKALQPPRLPHVPRSRRPRSRRPRSRRVGHRETRFSTFCICKKISEYKSKINSVTNFVVMGAKKEIFQVKCSTYHALLSFYENLNEQPEATSPNTLQESSNTLRAPSASPALNSHRKSDKMQVIHRAATPLAPLRKIKRDTIFKKRRTNRNFFIKFRSRLVRGFDFYHASIFSKERLKSTIDSYNSLIYKPFDNSFCFYKVLARKSFLSLRGITPKYALCNQKLPITRKFPNIRSTENLAGTSLDASRVLLNASSQVLTKRSFVRDASQRRCKREILLENPTEVMQVIPEGSNKIRTKQKQLIFSKRSTNFVKKEIRRQDKVFKSDICLRNIIPLDFTLSPVLKVNFVIEIDDEVLYLRQKIRERIILEIWTNGSIHPRQAVHDATLSLLDMFSSFRSLYQTSDYSSPLLQLPRYS